MRCKVERKSDSLMLVSKLHWWSDSLSPKDVLAALTEISKDNKIVSVCRLSGWTTQYLVVVEKK